MPQTPEATEPEQIQPLGSREMMIGWKDGHVSVYSFPYLRRNCQCANCIHETTGRKLLDPKSVSEDIKVSQTKRVGNYAIRFRFSDGHITGIYPFDFLRSMCPCAECADGSSKEN